jgi:hypothetical protein
MTREQQFNYITYGSKASPERVTHLLDHFSNLLTTDNLLRPTPFCIWGMHGIGKTELVKDYALTKGYQFRYIAPAQFEEMGDFLGMPKVEGLSESSTTKFIPPDWVPKDEGPGIFLIDDVNRADDRILRGIMQLLQNYELVSWKLPAKWLIVLTANPDGGDYSVTTMDDAMITRMIHVTMEFDVKAWARWAELKRVDPRGIDFVLTYPEIVNSSRTTPRSLIQFFSAIHTISDFKHNLDLVKILADGCLDPETAIAFINFINMDLDKIVSPEEILSTPDFRMISGKIKESVDGKTKRMDILSVIMTRLTNYLLYKKEELSDKSFDNLKSFILLPFIPNDLRLSMAQDLVSSNKKDLKKLYSIPEIGKLILTKM